MTGQEPDVGSPPTLAPPPGAGTATDFRLLFETAYRPLVAYARRRCHSPSDADDLVGEVFAVAWRRRDQLDPGTAPLPWLYGIAGNVLRNQRRSGQRHLRLVDHLQAQPDPAPTGNAADPADTATGTGDGAEVRAALATLSFDDQEVLRLIAWEGLTHAEVGQVLACTANAVAIRAHRARQRLAAALTADHAAGDPTTSTHPTNDHLTTDHLTGNQPTTDSPEDHR